MPSGPRPALTPCIRPHRPVQQPSTDTPAARLHGCQPSRSPAAQQPRRPGGVLLSPISSLAAVPIFLELASLHRAPSRPIPIPSDHCPALPCPARPCPEVVLDFGPSLPRIMSWIRVVAPGTDRARPPRPLSARRVQTSLRADQGTVQWGLTRAASFSAFQPSSRALRVSAAALAPLSLSPCPLCPPHAAARSGGRMRHSNRCVARCFGEPFCRTTRVSKRLTAGQQLLQVQSYNRLPCATARPSPLAADPSPGPPAPL
ncbi:hypothetical protein BS50DRAFT_371865 [Corynespora cassiicola Philippines]|uniref:Uncharacterized protein n=1 Tax=Corynespora cassiicola Philippines TaxID=1448308 RepID=A0A2T2NN50_CORCC|nr:hypothetical protein BS50DRAFT_371865 [Corynespora cassiicola Philippines]